MLQDAKINGISISQLTVDILMEHYGLAVATENKKALSEIIDEVIDEVKTFVKDHPAGTTFDLLTASETFKALIVYTSDQGFYMGEHGWFDKRFMYEESFRTPLLMRLPGGKKGDIPQLVQNIDYAPTFLELAGAPIPADIQGESLLPLLKGERPENWRNSLYYHYYEYPAEHSVKRHYGVRDDRYKLIHFYNDIDVWELYDLQEDPHEMNNLYGKPSYEAVMKRMRDELYKLQKQYDDPVGIRFNVSD